MRYRRDRSPGATWFFTLVTWRRRPLFADPANVARLRAAFAHTRTVAPYRIDALVLLPDHLHCIWTLPDGDADFSTRWNRIKGSFTRSLPPAAKSLRGSPSRRERCVWQRRFWEHRIRDDVDFARHCDYIHWNPVRHGLATRPDEWPYSSFARFVQAGIYPADWCMGEETDGLKAG
ncbi:hypothetical protein M622_16995 [Thauera terpenica 58Eu]|uniref:Transposase IS200-like domain-containing protein n=1 Tax=Thauera terpenica 58Eu TaxID=1348657 RepID=S9ZKH9_9RHOO|nr:transposase [Thauera terpenica]EPZ15061.1 hypothetical protein M622_16995 [Thauera terpenica 58Eu]